ncbi:transcriptional regulator [Steroidobacter agaridevorans]|uniref:Transcriptional regulator n=1 Tax=Steroidobacter agaridevorans TaxID=2695856 RepID=A0A829YCZ8_9GAMM|nr:LysR family transcriptional regulator [Steroidobacter agaridevorans]GFE81115.1 transcriptional regulator [Steroidobacter agaridevorans]GFE89000.1 transcriptional regulator [Steroidobacter agaridevorans]
MVTKAPAETAKKPLQTMRLPHISMEQWRCLIAVVEAGGYARAAEALHKSQSSVTYAVQKLESTLQVKAFEIQGRKAKLTPVGEMLYRRGRLLLEEADAIERAASRASAGWEAEISIAVEILFPTWLMFQCLDRFGRESPQTRIEWFETVLDGTPEALRTGQADLAITGIVPPGVPAEHLMMVRASAVAHPDHELHKLGRPVEYRDLRKHRHIIVRDSSAKRDKKALTLDVARRWTVSNMATSIGAVSRGYGFSWLPEDKIRTELQKGELKLLPMRDMTHRMQSLYLAFADRDGAGPGALRLAEIIKEEVKSACLAAGRELRDVTSR